MLILGVFFTLWLSTGGIIALCAVEFLPVDKSKIVAKTIVAIIAGPLSLNRDWWLR